MPTVLDFLNIFGGHRSRVEIDGIGQAAFREVDGLCVSIEVQEFREGTDKSSAFNTIPGLVRYGPLILRNAVTGNPENKDLWNWIKQVIDGEEAKKNMSVIIMDRKGNDKLRFNLTGAWPSSWRLGKLDSHSSSPLVEELVLQYQSLSVS